VPHSQFFNISKALSCMTNLLVQLLKTPKMIFYTKQNRCN
jgi:hypothetical protein